MPSSHPGGCAWEPGPVWVPLIQPLSDTGGFWKCARSRLDKIIFASVVLTGWRWPLSRELGCGSGSFPEDFVQHLYCSGCPHLTPNAHPQCSEQSVTDSYWFGLKFASGCVHVGGEKFAKSIHLLFCPSSTIQFSSKVIHAAFSSWPSSNALAQFCCFSELIIHSGEQNYTFAAFRALCFLPFIWKKKLI